MAKAITKKIKLQIPAGKATPAPPVGTVLGPAGINLQEFCTKFNDATNTLTTLNEKLVDLKEVEEKYNADKFEKALNERTVEFEVKFKGVNALDKFETEEVQNLIKDSVENNDALISLNSMLVDLIPNKVDEKKDDKNGIKDFNSKEVKNLIPKDNSFESRYLQ